MQTQNYGICCFVWGGIFKNSFFESTYDERCLEAYNRYVSHRLTTLTIKSLLSFTSPKDGKYEQKKVGQPKGYLVPFYSDNNLALRRGLPEGTPGTPGFMGGLNPLMAGYCVITYTPGPKDMAWMKNENKAGLRYLSNSDSSSTQQNQFLREMTPGGDGKATGLNLASQHHRELKTEFRSRVSRLCKKRGIHMHPALMNWDDLIAKSGKIERPNQSLLHYGDNRRLVNDPDKVFYADAIDPELSNHGRYQYHPSGSYQYHPSGELRDSHPLTEYWRQIDNSLYIAALESKAKGLGEITRLLSAKADINTKLQFPLSQFEHLTGTSTVNHVLADATVSSEAPRYTQAYEHRKGNLALDRDLTFVFYESLLHAAAKAGNPAAVRLLLENDASMALSVYGQSPLVDAIKSGSVECAQLLLEAKADPLRLSNITSLGDPVMETTPLDDAFITCNPHVVFSILPFVEHLNRHQLKRLLLLTESLPAEIFEGDSIEIKLTHSEKIDSNLLQNIIKLNALSFFSVVQLNLAKSSVSDLTLDVNFFAFLMCLRDLRSLNLANNHITYTGTLALSGVINNHPALHTLNLSNNRITLAPQWLDGLNKRFSACGTLKKILISANFLDPECETEQLLHPTSEPTAHFRYSLFSSAIKPSKSLLEPQSTRGITLMHWMICLACRKGSEHSRIFLEGMRKSGQKFLEQYDLRATAIVGQAAISIERFDPASFNHKNYHRATKQITEAQGISVQDHVKRDHDNPSGIAFSKSYPGSKRHNCLTWSRKILKKIHLKTAITFYPSTASIKGFTQPTHP